ncbi:20083_t:CDS:2 [Funneliformis geosporum]|nr:20083_t:CDS:2 [Funneliformis geosporum]
MEQLINNQVVLKCNGYYLTRQQSGIMTEFAHHILIFLLLSQPDRIPIVSTSAYIRREIYYHRQNMFRKAIILELTRASEDASKRAQHMANSTRCV